MLFISLCANAQGRHSVKGVIIDKETKDVVEGATVQLLSLPDSAFVKGAVASQTGSFSFPN